MALCDSLWTRYGGCYFAESGPTGSQLRQVYTRNLKVVVSLGLAPTHLIPYER